MIQLHSINVYPFGVVNRSTVTVILGRKLQNDRTLEFPSTQVQRLRISVVTREKKCDLQNAVSSNSDVCLSAQRCALGSSTYNSELIPSLLLYWERMWTEGRKSCIPCLVTGSFLWDHLWLQISQEYREVLFFLKQKHPINFLHLKAASIFSN